MALDAKLRVYFKVFDGGKYGITVGGRGESGDRQGT